MKEGERWKKDEARRKKEKEKGVVLEAWRERLSFSLYFLSFFLSCHSFEDRKSGKMEKDGEVKRRKKSNYSQRERGRRDRKCGKGKSVGCQGSHASLSPVSWQFGHMNDFFSTSSFEILTQPTKKKSNERCLSKGSHKKKREKGAHHGTSYHRHRTGSWVNQGSAADCTRSASLAPPKHEGKTPTRFVKKSRKKYNVSWK